MTVRARSAMSPKWLTASAAAVIALSSLTFVPAVAGAEPVPSGPVNNATHFATDFADGDAGQTPAGWTSRWSPDTELVLADNPRRAVLTVGNVGRSLWSFDAADDISGDVEMAGVVRAPSPLANTVFQMHLFAGGTDAATTASYYLDYQAGKLRISRYAPSGGFSLLRSTDAELNADRWYNVVLRKELPNLLYGKIWPYGEPEPAGWTGQTTSAVITHGMAGIGQFIEGATNEWAWFSVATQGGTAQRAPADLLPVPAAPEQVSGVSVDQRDGFATVGWSGVAADSPASYEISRTPVDAAGTPTGGHEVVGVWNAGRTPGDNLTFADSGFAIGARYAWAVRAVVDGIPGAWSDPILGTTQGVQGPDEFRTPWEQSGGLTWTPYQAEQDYLAGIDAATERMRVVEYGRTAQDRALNVAIIGNPAPASADAVAATRPVLVDCTVHGNEPAPREACLILIRELSFSDDPWVLDLLATSTVLVVPTMNPDGREANTRANSRGQDLNRDHSLLRENETYAFAQLMRDYGITTAMDGHEYGNSGTGDLPVLWPRNLNVDDGLVQISQDDLVLGQVYDEAGQSGWWPVPYPIGYAQETILRNTAGLKNVVSMLLESRISGGSTRPAEGGSTSASNRERRAYSQLWTFHQVLDFHRTHYDQIVAAVDHAKASQVASAAPVYLDGSRTTPTGTPPDQAPTRVLDPAPCGYLLTAGQLETGTPTVARRLAAHGIQTLDAGSGSVLVPMAQPLRGLIPLLLDPQAIEGMVAGQRVVSDCVVASTVTMEVSDTPAGSAAAATVTVTSGAPVAGGAVEILEGDTVVGTGVLAANGTVTISLAGLAAGTHVLAARFAGLGPAAGATSSSVRVVVYFPDAGPENLFYDDIAWMIDNGIVNGYRDGTFRPTTTVSRQVMAAYLYRLDHPGAPEIECTGADRRFTDVTADNEFCGEIEWLAGLGTVRGYTDGTFRPGTALSRQAVAAMLYRFEHPGEGDAQCAGGQRRFTDVPAGGLFCGDIEWLAGVDVVRGYDDGTFLPLDPMSRQASSAMLHRFAGV